MPAEMTLRDDFAAAALTGLLVQGDDGSFSEESYVRAAYRWADAMLRCRAGGDCPGQDNAPNHDAAPAAKASEATASPERVRDRGDAGTGNTQKPVAWAVADGHEFMEFCTDLEDAKCAAGFYCDCPIIPLYRQPQPTLTDAERSALWDAAEAYAGNNDDPECERIATALQGLWQRTK